jgi:hypothetical protein
MSVAVEFGIPGLEVEHGDHICGIYADTRERDQILIPFLEAGLRAGEKCICVVDGTEPTTILSALGDEVEAPERAASKQLDVMRSSDVYLRSGAFSAPEVIGAWKGAISEAMYDGRFVAVRAVETWSDRDVVPDRTELLGLEAEMNRYLPLFPQVILCLYDITRFGGGLVVDLFKSHSRVLVGGRLFDSPYAIVPDEITAAVDVAARHDAAPLKGSSDGAAT